MNKKNNNNKISTYKVNKTEENKSDNKKQISTQITYNVYLNDFSSFPNGWYEGRGIPTENDDGTYNGRPTGSTSAWDKDGFSNNGSSGAARVNIYWSNKSEWLISPVFTLFNDGVYTVSCDASATEWNRTTEPIWGTDDWVALFMTSDGQPDGGFPADSTWIELKRWDKDNNPGKDGEPTGDIPIMGYPNIDYTNVQFAFYAETTVHNEDIDFFIDNFKVNLTLDGVGDEDNGDVTGTVDPHNSLAILTQPTNGTATINSQGNWSYTPNEHFYGIDTFIVTIDGSTEYKTLKILINPVDDNPTITGDISGFFNGQPVTGQLIVNDVDGFTNDNRFSLGHMQLSTVHLQNTFSGGTEPDDWTTQKQDGSALAGWRFLSSSGAPPAYDARVDGSYNDKSHDTFVFVDFSYTSNTAILQTNTNQLPVGNLTIIFDFFSVNVTYSASFGHNELYLEIEDENGNWVIIGDPFANNEGSPFKRNTYSNRENQIYGWETINVQYYNSNPNANLRFRAEPMSGYKFYNDFLISDFAVGFTLGEITLDNDGNWTYTPNTDFYDVGTDTFTILIRDDFGNQTSQNITINSLITGDFTGVVDEDSGEITGKLNINPAAQNVTNSDPFSITTYPTNGTANIDNDGNWSYTPSEHFNGTDTFIVTLTDDESQTKNFTITITVNSVNDLPTITGDPSGFYRGNNQPVTGQITVIDIDGFTNGNRFAILTQPNNGTATFNNQGNWTYTPNVNFMDTDTFLIRITDDDGHIEDRPITITGAVSGDNTGTGNEDSGPITGQITINIAYSAIYSITNSDPFSITTDPTNGTATINSQGNWSYTPNEHFYGTDTFIVTLTEDDNNTQTRTITITVNSVNDLPTITGDISGEFYIVQPVTGQLAVTDPDGFTIGNSGYTNNTNYSNMSNNYHTTVINGIEHVIKSRKYGVSTAMTTNELDTYMTEVTTTPWYGDIDLAYQIAIEAGTGISGFTGTNSQNKYGPNFIYEITGNTMKAVRQHDGQNSNGYSNTMNPTGDIRGDIMVAYIVSIENKFSISGTPNYGTAIIDNDGNWTYTPNANFDTTDTFTVLITDDLGNTQTQDITLTKLISVKPYIISSNKADSIMEHSGPNQIIYKAFADDPDNASSNLTYFMEYTDKFTINKYTGEVRLIPNPVYAVKSEYTFNVYAKDPDGNTGYSKTVTLKILPASITLKQPDINGFSQNDIIIQAKKGWKLIGTTTESILLKNNLIVSNSIYMFKGGYETIAYSEEDKGYPLKANKGIWIKLDW